MGRFSVNTSLEKDINYGIIMDYKLIGSVRVLENLDIPDKDNLYRDILKKLGCGL